jgi:putative phosphoesterase
MQDPAPMLVGLIADTHGLIRPEALKALSDVDVILHAGDVGAPAVLDALWAVAPVHAVRGNVDGDGAGAGLRDSLHIQLDGVKLHLSHGHELGSPTPAALAARYQADVIVYGHTHRALVTHVGSTLVINPGAAGPRRFDLQPSVGLLTLPSREVRIVLV